MSRIDKKLTIGHVLLEPLLAKLAKMDSTPAYRDEIDALIAGNRQFIKQHLSNKIKALEFLEGMESHKPEHLNAHHPQRSKLGRAELLTQLSLGEFMLQTAYYAAKANIAVSDAIAVARSCDSDTNKRLNQSKAVDGGIHDGNNIVSLMPLFHRFKEGATLVFADDLMRELQLTDLSKGVSVDMIIPPFESCFIAFGETPQALDPIYTLHNSVSGLHALEGAYINVYEVASEAVAMFPDYCKPLKLHKESKVICLEVLFTGRPKDRMLNDASHHANLYFDLNSEYCASEQLQHNLEYYAAVAISDAGKASLSPTEQLLLMDDMTRTQITNNFGLLTKLLVYLNCADMRRERHEPAKALAKQLAGTKNVKKARRIEALLRGAMDYTLICGHGERLDFAGDSEDASGKRPHWRRGFLRNQRYGEGRARTRLVHI
ncbi:MAG: hypothetical protein ACRC4U_12300, partial [Shewanella sp.]